MRLRICFGRLRTVSLRAFPSRGMHRTPASRATTALAGLRPGPHRPGTHASAGSRTDDAARRESAGRTPTPWSDSSVAAPERVVNPIHELPHGGPDTRAPAQVSGQEQNPGLGRAHASGTF